MHRATHQQPVRAAARRGALALGLCLALSSLSSCLRVEWTRYRANEEPAPERVGKLAIDRSTLQNALDSLGAPNFVFGAESDQVWLVWVWRDESKWGVAISYELVDFVSASFEFSEIDEETMGYALLFDEERTLRELRRGRLSKILDGAVTKRSRSAARRSR